MVYFLIQTYKMKLEIIKTNKFCIIPSMYYDIENKYLIIALFRKILFISKKIKIWIE